MDNLSTSLMKAASFSPDLIQDPVGWCGHLPFASWIIRFIQPKIFVELGTHTGNSYFSFCQSVKESGLSTKCYAVDTWQGDEHAGLYSDDIFNSVNSHNREQFSQFSNLMRMKFDDALNYFSDGSIQLLHIDGLHTYEAVLHDYNSWLKKLAPGAVVLFHDTNVKETDFGVWKLWEELQKLYPNNLEFPHSHGLGVLQLDTDATDINKICWLDPNSNDRQIIKEYFAELGKRQLERFELDQALNQANLAISSLEILQTPRMSFRKKLSKFIKTKLHC